MSQFSSSVSNSSLAMVGLKLQLLVNLLLAAAVLVAAQNCGCAKDLCCSKYGYCGTGDPYCGDGCQSGPCYSRKRSDGGVSVTDVVTQQFFDGIIRQARADCKGRGFYTLQAFLDAAGKYSGFGQHATIDNSKREIAAFFAHVAHDTGRFCYKEHKDKPNYYCDDNNSPQYSCTPEKKNYGREPLRFFWNYNNGPAGHDIGFHSPKSLDATVTFETALGFWMKNVHNVLGQGFGATIKAINGQRECNGTNTIQVNNRISLYKDYCRQFGVFPGDNLTC